MEIDVVDVQDESDLLDQMGNSSEAVELESECLPLVLDQVLDQIRLEHREFIRVCQCFHNLAIRLRHRWKNIELVSNLERLHSIFLFITHSVIPIEELLINIWILVSELEV